MIFKNSVRTAKKTQLFTITSINWLTLFKEIIPVYTQNHTKSTNKKWKVIDCWSRWDISLPLDFKGLEEAKLFTAGEYTFGPLVQELLIGWLLISLFINSTYVLGFLTWKSKLFIYLCFFCPYLAVSICQVTWEGLGGGGWGKWIKKFQIM
jgi:hypothetical protein